MIRVAVVEDQQLIRGLVRAKLESDPEIRVVAEAASGEEARRVVPGARPDVVLMDLSMPGIGGIEATRRLLSALPGLKIVALSMHVDGPLPGRFLGAGGVGYVSKNARAAELVEAVRRVHEGGHYLSSDVAASILEPTKAAGPAVLTVRELQVLERIAQGKGSEEIAQQLKLSVKTVQAHRRHLLEKLGARNDVQLARLARDHGLVS